MTDETLKAVAGEELAKGVVVYRISKGADRWRRRWQAEWPMCATAPRAWTKRGVIRKALRWRRYGTDLQIAARKYARWS